MSIEHRMEVEERKRHALQHAEHESVLKDHDRQIKLLCGVCYALVEQIKATQPYTAAALWAELEKVYSPPADDES